VIRRTGTMALSLMLLLGGASAGLAQPTSAAQSRPNVVVLLADDVRWDAMGVAGNPIVQTPRLDRLAEQGVRFTRAYVTTSICWVSRASILTGQYMSRHTRTAAADQLSPEAFAQTYPGVLRGAGYWTGFVGKWHIGQIRSEDFDFTRSYQGRHWIDDPDRGRIHVTEMNALDALQFLRERPKDRPFLLNVSFFAAHAEDSAPEQYLPQEWSARYYQGVTIPTSPLSRREYFEALPEFIRAEANEGRVRYHWRFDTPERYQQYMINYYRLITEMDEAIGRLLDELEAQGVSDNTLILYAGDNGYFQADRGLADKWYAYEESIRVPLLIRDPRLRERGMTRDQTVLNIDLAPTVLAAVGVAVPATMQGVDVAPLYLAAQPPAWRDEFFYEHPTVTSRARIPSSQAVVRRDLKYVLYPEWEYEQLFDLRSDPTELRNLAGDASARALLETMRTKLADWRLRAR
jgi:arylsulfatase